MLYAVIVAGGQGTRLWPSSRKRSPKQLTPFAGGKSLIQRTYERISKLVPPERIYIVTNLAYAEEFLDQIPELTADRLILEPVGRNTAAAVGIGAAVLHQIDPEAVMVNIWADHYYDDEEGYLKVVKTAEGLVARHPDQLVNMVATPTYPSSAFDYFKVGEKLEELNGLEVYKIGGFARKPDRETAEKYLTEGDYYWNITNFVWRVDTLLGMFKQFAPAMYEGLTKIAQTWGTPEWNTAMAEGFPKLEANTIDYTIFEHSKDILLIPVHVGWKDVGNWQIVHEMLAGIDGSNMVSRGKVVTVETEDSLIFNENEGKLVAVVGMKDVVVVDTPDALLVMPKSRDQEVKKIISHLEETGDLEHL